MWLSSAPNGVVQYELQPTSEEYCCVPGSQSSSTPRMHVVNSMIATTGNSPKNALIATFTLFGLKVRAMASLCDYSLISFEVNFL